MKEDNASIIARFGPDLLIAPHVLPTLLELVAGDIQKIDKEQEHLQAHLTVCHYCRTALITLLIFAQEYDWRNDRADTAAHDLLTRFVNINDEIEANEAREHELLGAYSEAIVAEGLDKANRRFPGVAAHIRLCSDCRSLVEANVFDLLEEI